MKRNDILVRVRQTVKAHRMLGKGDSVLAAVSGGADSVVMLHLLAALKDELGLSLSVFHLNHNLRGAESAGDLAFVRRLAKRLGLPFESRKLRAGELDSASLSLQEAARAARYRHMTEAAKKLGTGKIALGHTMDDQAETVLLRLVKGGGPAGLSGIPPVRGPFVRPLIDISREEVEAYAKAGKLRYRTDSSNLSPKYLRNDIRLNLLPYLKSRFNPNITASLVRLSAILRADEDFIDGQAASALERAIVEKSRRSVALDRRLLAALHDAVKARVIMKTIWYLTGESDIYSAHITSVIKLAASRRPNASVDLPGGIKVVRAYDRLVIGFADDKEAAQEAGFCVPLVLPGMTVLPGRRSLRASYPSTLPSAFDTGPDTAYFDAASFEAGGPYVVRRMRPGDRMSPFGMSGTKKVKEILIEKKVQPASRRSIPMLCSADEVIWAAGVRRSDRHRVSARTQRVVKIELLKG